MTSKIAITCLIPITLCAIEPASAPKLNSEEDAKALVEACLKQMVAGDYKAGFDLLKPYWSAPANEIDTIIMQTVSTRNVVKERFGNSIGIEFIATHHSGKSFLRFLAIEKLEKTAIRYSVVFYKARDTWEIQSFTWDDKVNLLFQ